MQKFDDNAKKKLECLLFSKGIHNLESGKLDRKLMSQTKENIDNTKSNSYYNYLK